MPEGSLLQLDMTLLIRTAIHWVNIILLTLILIYLLYKPVKNFMAQRAQRIRGDIESAVAVNEKAQALKQQYEDLISGIDAKREEIISQAQSQALEKSDEILLDARKEATYLLQKAEDKIVTERRHAAEENKRLIIDLATKMAAHFVSVSIEEPDRDKYLDQALTDWSEKTWRA